MIVKSWNDKQIKDCDREELLSLIEHISQREIRTLQKLHRLEGNLSKIREIIDILGNDDYTVRLEMLRPPRGADNATYPTYTKGESCTLTPTNFRVTEFEITGSPGNEEDEDDGA